MRNNIFEIKGKYLIFKTGIAKMKTHLPIDNKSKAKLIDEFFVYANKILFSNWKNLLTLHSETVKLSSNLLKKTIVNIVIRDYIKQVVCYLAKLDAYLVILSNK